MEKDEQLEDTIYIAYILLEKSYAQGIRISYNKLQCMIYQLNKSYYHYKNELFYDIDTITSDAIPINMSILTEFASFRNKDYINYTPSIENLETSIDLTKSIFLDFVCTKYFPISDKKILDYTLRDTIFENKSGINMTKDSFENEVQDKSIKAFMDFMIK